MTKAKDPFLGVKLTEPTPAPVPGRDQRLFSTVAPRPRPTDQEQPPAPPAPEPTPAAKRITAEPRNIDKDESRNLGRLESSYLGPEEPRNIGSNGSNAQPRAKRPAQRGTPAVTPPTRFSFDLRPSHQANFVFTDDELEALDDLKRDARRQHGLTATKQDIVRRAVLDLLEDYDAHGDNSRFIRWLKDRAHRG